MRNSGGLKTARSGRLKSLRAETTIKTVGEDSPKSALETKDLVPRAEHIDPIDIMHHQGRAIHECAPPPKGTYPLLLLWRRSDRQEQSISSSGTPRTGTKTSSSQTRISSPSRSSTTIRTRFMLKCPMRWRKTFRGCREAITLSTSWFGGGCPVRGNTSSFLQERGETGARVYHKDVLHVVKHRNISLFSGQEWVFQQDSAPAHNAKTTQEWLWRNLLTFISAENWPSGSADLKPLDNKLWTVLEDMEASQQPGEPEEIPCKDSIRDLPGYSACSVSRVAGTSQGLRW